MTKRDIRLFTTGRKNGLFSIFTNGAWARTNLYRLVMTCRANDINPYYYFQHLFTELLKRKFEDDLTDLMPWDLDLGESE